MTNDGGRMDGQLAFITGGGGGIGRAIALGFAENGADVAILEKYPERIAETVATIEGLGRRAIGICGDAMDLECVETAIAESQQHFGRIDILVNNAGGTTHKPFLDQSRRSWQRHIDLNFTSMLAATAAAAPLMITGGRGGAILNVASMEATRAAPGFAVYGACKAAMASFTKSMAVELAEHGIRVNCINPDHTVTPGTMGNRAGAVDVSSWKQRSDAHVDAMNRLIPLGREGIDSECGDAAVFLCSSKASYITGAILPVDGGTWASGGWVRRPEGGWTLNQGLSFG